MSWRGRRARAGAASYGWPCWSSWRGGERKNWRMVETRLAESQRPMTPHLVCRRRGVLVITAQDPVPTDRPSGSPGSQTRGSSRLRVQVRGTRVQVQERQLPEVSRRDVPAVSRRGRVTAPLHSSTRSKSPGSSPVGVLGRNGLGMDTKPATGKPATPLEDPGSILALTTTWHERPQYPCYPCSAAPAGSRVSTVIARGQAPSTGYSRVTPQARTSPPLPRAVRC